MSKVVTGKVRFSYVHVFETREIGGEEKYSITLLIPKSDTITYQNIMNEINKTVQEAVAEIFGGAKPTNLALPLYDGDGLRASGEPFGAECKGHWVISAKSINAPEVVDTSMNPILSRNEFYSGCFGRASLTFYVYNKNGNKGVGCGLGNVQKLEDGQPLDGRTTAAEDFGTPIAPATGVYGAAQPATPVSPIAGQQTAPMQQAVAPQYIGQVDPITGQPIMPQNTINNIYGVGQ